MIPKIIHYCWLSNDPMPAELKRCIKSWKRKLPDYKIKKWDTHNFDIYSIPFVAEACKMRKWAFACDYIRVYALYTEGGIYLDSDVFVRNSLDFCLANRAFSAVECYPDLVEKIYAEGQVDAEGNKRKDIQYIDGIQIQAAILGAEKGHPFMRDCMNYYHDKHFILQDGSLNNKIISPFIFANIAIDYGFKFKDEEQDLKSGLKIYSSSLFASNMELITEKAVAIHCCAGSWRWMPSSSMAYAVQYMKEIIKNILFRLRYCFNIAKHPQLLPFAVSRVWTLLVPCVLYTVVSLVVSPEYICEGRYYELKTLLPGALWFLPILFIVEVLGYNVARFRGVKIFVILLCVVLAAYFRFREFPLTYRLIQIPMCLLFYLIGNSLRKYAIVERFLMNSNWMPWWKYCLLGLLGCVLAYVYVRTDALKHNQEILNYFEIGMVLACFSAIVGVASFSVFSLKRMPKLGNVLIYIGRNTLIIMSVQGIFISLADYFLRPLIPSFAIGKLVQFIFVFSCCLIMIPLINKYIPVLGGKGIKHRSL